MKIKPLKIKIKEPTPSAADRMNARHQAIRKEKGLPDPSEYKKKLDVMKKEEVEQLDELSPETKSSYVSKAKEQIKQTEPWTKKGEYKDLAKNLIAKRQKGIAKMSEQHINGRFHPTKPRNVQNTPTASPRVKSDSAEVRLKEVAEPTGDLKKACWKGYTAVGMKMKNGRKVPNCVPIKESDDVKADQISTDNQKFPKKMTRKAKIVKDIAKGKSDQFQANPILDSDVNPQTNKQ